MVRPADQQEDGRESPDNGRGETVVDRRRLEILQATYDVLLENGYDGTSTLAVARRAHSSKETLYDIFETKRALLRALVEWRFAAITRAILDGGSATAPFEDQLMGFAQRLMAEVSRNETIEIVRVATILSRQEAGLDRSIHEKTSLPLQKGVIAILEIGRTQGQITYGDAQDAYDVLLGLLFGARMVRWLLGEAPDVRADMIGWRARLAVRRFLGLFAPSADDRCLPDSD